MADNTHIEWTDATWNPVTGCSVTSPGCTNCYAMKLAGTRLAHHPSRAGLTQDTKAGPVWTGEVRLNEDWLTQPLKWKRPRRIFVCAHGDLFHGNVPDEWIDRVFAVMALAPQHTFQVLTKRAGRMRKYLETVQADPVRRTSIYAIGARMMANGDPRRRDVPPSFPLPNIWLGVSVEDQARADERIPDLLATPAAVRFISAEPLLGPVDLTSIPWPEHWPRCDCLQGSPRYDALEATVYCPGCCEGPEAMDAAILDWVIVGGESGPGARPMHPDWARSLRDQCQAAGVPFFFKQWGEFAPGEIAGEYLDPEKAAKGLSRFDGRWDECWSEVDGHCDDEPDVYRLGKARAGRLLDGREWNEVPA